MADKMVGEVQLAGATVRVRFVSQKRRNEIGEQCRQRKPGELTAEVDFPKQTAMLARETIAGWENLTPLDCLELGFEDYETLPVDNGCVPFSEETAVKLYADCIWSHFRGPIDDVSLNLAREVAREKKRLAGSSAT